MKLTPTQQDLLEEAAGRSDGLLVRAITTSVRKALIASGFVADDGGSLRITDAGRATLPSPETCPEAAQVQTGNRPAPTGKLALIVDLLGRPDGANLADLQGATGWQAHSVRGALAGALKKRFGLTVASQLTETGRIYRLTQSRKASTILDAEA